MNHIRLAFFLSILLIITNKVAAQEIPSDNKMKMENFLTEKIRQRIHSGKIKLDSVSVQKKKLQLFFSSNLSYTLFDQSDVKTIYDTIRTFIPDNVDKKNLEIFSDGYKIEEYIPLTRKERYTNKKVTPLVTNLSRPSHINKGLQDRHIAMWQSHGLYYEQKLARWEWQRARTMQTVEDLYTQSYVLPYLVPMLENAGANVLLPRERDIQRHEVIVDNDFSTGDSEYKETNGKEKWTTANALGFGNIKEFYENGENPFRLGTYRQINTTKNDESFCEWLPSIPEKGKYAVYISYTSLDKSTEDAHYTVYHLGGKTDFSVNQKMGGGTWIFLGFFSFDKGKNNDSKVVLSNKSKQNGRIVTADAVKIGGGLGNIARKPNTEGLVTENTKSSESLKSAEQKELPKIDYALETSGYPRYTEGARYWMQWAGVPDSVYSWSKFKNDYTDDYQGRGLWVNYLAGGSSALPKRQGLNIPIDMSMAFHSDAGVTFNDSIIGTLGIVYTHHNNEKFANGQPRIISRDLMALMMDEIVTDLRAQYEPEWTRRQLWNKNYSEARIPEVPSVLLELLSHQNFADMRYGLDPRFQFSVSRSIYKAILKFMAYQYKYDYVVQPLPVNSFSLNFASDTKVNLQWQPVEDKTEPTAKPSGYIVYTRKAEGDFDNGVYVKDTKITLDIEKDKIYSFKITAINDGGESFPSEILSVCRKSNEKGNVLVVNGFQRLSAPFSFATTDSIAGFMDSFDHGVPDKVQYNYVGSQYEYRRQIPWMDDDAPGFGGSNTNFETTVVAGNTFDYPFVHGKSIANAGYSFISTSSEAVINEQTDLNKYKFVDLILGKQKQTIIGRGAFPAQFKTFSTELQNRITEYCKQGGNIFVSGAFVASDLWDSGTKADKDFAQNTLRYKWRTHHAAVTGKVKAVASPFKLLTGDYNFHTQLNSECYAAESPDGIEPAGENSYTIFRYNENNISAGIASDGSYKTLILGFPFETLETENQRNSMMSNILQFMSNNKQ